VLGVPYLIVLVEVLSLALYAGLRPHLTAAGVAAGALGWPRHSPEGPRPRPRPASLLPSGLRRVRQAARSASPLQGGRSTRVVAPAPAKPCGRGARSAVVRAAGDRRPSVSPHVRRPHARSSTRLRAALDAAVAALACPTPSPAQGGAAAPAARAGRAAPARGAGVAGADGLAPAVAGAIDRLFAPLAGDTTPGYAVAVLREGARCTPAGSAWRTSTSSRRSRRRRRSTSPRSPSSSPPRASRSDPRREGAARGHGRGLRPGAGQVPRRRPAARPRQAPGVHDERAPRLLHGPAAQRAHVEPLRPVHRRRRHRGVPRGRHAQVPAGRAVGLQQRELHAAHQGRREGERPAVRRLRGPAPVPPAGHGAHAGERRLHRRRPAPRRRLQPAHGRGGRAGPQGGLVRARRRRAVRVGREPAHVAPLRRAAASSPRSRTSRAGTGTSTRGSSGGRRRSST
jgi:hypothetical protein